MPSSTPEGQIDRLAMGVARGLSVRGASRAAGIAPRTAQRWASAPTFPARVRRLREAIVSRAVGKLAAVAAKAAVRLGRLVDSADEDIALKASRGILQDLLAVRDSLDLAARLEALEAHADETHKL